VLSFAGPAEPVVDRAGSAELLALAGPDELLALAGSAELLVLAGPAELLGDFVGSAELLVAG